MRPVPEPSTLKLAGRFAISLLHFLSSRPETNLQPTNTQTCPLTAAGCHVMPPPTTPSPMHQTTYLEPCTRQGFHDLPRKACTRHASTRAEFLIKTVYLVTIKAPRALHPCLCAANSASTSESTQHRLTRNCAKGKISNRKCN